MALQSMTALASITLQANTGTVTFSNIPQGYRDLIMHFSGGSPFDNGGPVRININSNIDDFGAGVSMVGNGSTATSSSLTSSQAREIINSPVLQNDLNGTFTCHIIDAGVGSKQKTILTRSGNAGFQVAAIATRWAGQNIVSSVSFEANLTFLAGSTFNLYGRIA